METSHVKSIENKKKNHKKRQARTIKVLSIICIALTIIVALEGIFCAKLLKQSEEAEEITDVITIKTPYCKLYYPNIWGDEIEIENVEKEKAYFVEVYAKIDSYPRKKLFSINFNSNLGDKIGEIKNADEIVNVSIESYRTTDLEDWSDENRNKIASMQENVNFIIDSLKEVEGFHSNTP